MIAMLLLSTSLLSTTHASDDRQQDLSAFKSRKFAQDARNIVFDRVPPANLQSLRDYPQMREIVDCYQQYLLPRLVERAASSVIHQTIADDIAIIGLGKTKKQTETVIYQMISKHRKFISLEMGCPLSPYLLTHPDLSQINIADFGTYPEVLDQIKLMYAQIFKEFMPVEGEAQRLAFDAFAAVFPVKDIYFFAANLEQNILTFAEILAESLPFQETYRTLLTNEPFDQTSHIVISDSQIQDQEIQAKLKSILNTNPDHTVVLNINNTRKRGRFLSNEVSDFVKNTRIRHLQLVNSRGNVRIIGSHFLAQCDFLINVGMQGLTNLKLIESHFLNQCSSLINVNMQGLINLNSIENDCFNQCNSLIHVNMRSLTHLKSIGSNFLYNCPLLSNIYLKDLVNLVSVGGKFLYQTTLTPVQAKRLKKTIKKINTRKKIGLADFQLDQ